MGSLNAKTDVLKDQNIVSNSLQRIMATVVHKIIVINPTITPDQTSEKFLSSSHPSEYSWLMQNEKSWEIRRKNK